MKVMKFGGSTIKNPEMMNRVLDIIKSEKEEKVIVVSALHGQTNEIRQYLLKIETKNDDIDSFVSKVLKRHEDMAIAVIPKGDIQDNVIANIKRTILKLERLLYGVAYTEELTPKTQDMILSSAERMSAFLLEGALLSKGVNALAFESDKLGVITDGLFLCATADLPRCQENLNRTILPEIQNGKVPVITGFFGCDSEGRTTTFGKNGSDYSASVIAYALDADCLELWKDVDGFMSADPNMITQAHTIEELSYNEAAELAYFGNDILHPRTVGPVRIKEIPIMIKNIKNPQKRGTIICKRGLEDHGTIKSVAYSNDMVEIRISGSWAGLRSGTLSMVTGILGQNRINIFSVATSHTHLSLLIHKSDLKECLSVIKTVTDGVIEDITYFEDIALVCVVGEGSKGKLGLAGRLFTAVSEATVNVENISAGASDVAAHFIIKKEELRKTVDAIHSAFCLK